MFMLDVKKLENFTHMNYYKLWYDHVAHNLIEEIKWKDLTSNSTGKWSVLYWIIKRHMEKCQSM